MALTVSACEHKTSNLILGIHVGCQKPVSGHAARSYFVDQAAEDIAAADLLGGWRSRSALAR
jgi:hypothetical protein